MKTEIVQSHHFQCNGPAGEVPSNIQRLLPVVINVHRSGITNVLCHKLTKENTCAAANVASDQPLLTCTFVIQPIPLKEKISPHPACDISLAETNINTALIMRLRDEFDVATIDDILKIDFSDILELRRVGPQMIKTLLVELKTRGLKVQTTKSKIDLQNRFHGVWAFLIDDTIEFGVTKEEGSSSSS